jgi:1-acyl-sn-glycerol-3-phosphate acyltransferase
MRKLFTGIFDFFATRKPLLYLLFAGTMALFIVLALQVKFVEDISAVIPKDKKTEKLTSVFQNSKFADKLVMMVRLEDSTQTDPDKLVAYADELAAILAKDTAYIKQVNYKVADDLTFELFATIQNHLPVFLDEADYKKIDSLLTPAALQATLEQDIRLLTSPAGFALKEVISKDPSGISFLALKKLQQLQYDDQFELYDNHFVSKNQRNLLLFITPRYAAANTGANNKLLLQLDSSIDSLAKQESATGVAVSYFGAAAVSAGNAKQLRTDSLLTQGITVLFLILFIGLYFRKKRAPFLVLVPVVYGAAFSLAVIYLLKGSISVIALGTGSIVLGIAINYSLHVFNHYRHTKGLRSTIEDLAFPLTIGSITTIGGFLCLLFAKSAMLQDLGLFAACSLAGAAICSLVFLPHFIGTKKSVTTENIPAHKDSWIDKLAALKPEHNKWLVLGIVALTVLFLFYYNKVKFEPDMTSLNYMSAKLAKAEAQLNQIGGQSVKSLYLVTEGADREKALQQNELTLQQIETLKQKGLVTSFAGVSGLLISDSLQKRRIAQWNEYWTADKKATLIADIRQQGSALKFSATAFDNFENLLNSSFEPVDKMELADFQQRFLDDYITEKPGNVSVVTLLKVASENKPAVVAQLDTLQKVTVLDRQYLTARLTELVNKDFNKIALLTSCLVFFVLLLTFGRIELALVTFIPMLISWVWILGIMGMFGITFNIVNIIVSALIFGLGDDYSLFVMDGLLNEYRTGKKNLASYKSSIFLSAITTVVGLGVLAFAQHPALRSIAFISVTGILSVVIMSQVLIPFFFNLIIKNRVVKNFFPWTLWSWSRSVFSFTYFAFGAVVLTVIGVVLIKLNPFNKEKGKYIYHILLSKLCGSVLYIMGNFKKVVNNPLNEKFKKPAVMIANHQSFLDILAMTMLHPKAVLLTNKWVWNSPVFGAVVRMADFYPVIEGAENSIELMRDRVKEGYSIVVFPEGTRTSYPPMKRFHKGAFYLAHELDIDIVPILLHGTGYTMTKGDYLLKNGTLTVQYLPRISVTDKSWGEGYAARTKTITRYFKEEHKKLSQELETMDYYQEKLIYNYLYKGPVLEWYLRIKTKLEGNYKQFHAIVPQQGNILDMGCGYGFMSYMLHFGAPERNILGIDYDEEKIAVAAHGFCKGDNLHFLQADIVRFTFTTNYDAIIISDVLHYITPEEQEQVIENCIGHLQPGGKLIIRDGDADITRRHKTTKLTELFSTRLFGFNKTSGHGLHYLSGQSIQAIADKHRLPLTKMDNTKLTSNVIFVISKPHEL